VVLCELVTVVAEPGPLVMGGAVTEGFDVVCEVGVETGKI
jgi:hypothetical protein